MKKRLFQTTSLLLSLLLAGCFEVREEVNLKADGSGELSFVIDLSRSKGKMKQYMRMQRVESYRVPSEYEVETLLRTLKAGLQETEGITYVQTKSDWSNFIFTIDARFLRVDALNQALVKMGSHLQHVDMPPILETNFSYNTGSFKRFFDYLADPADLTKLSAAQRHLLEASSAISIYRFEKKVKEMTHEKAIVSPSGKAVMLKVSLFDLLNGTGTMANAINLE